MDIRPLNLASARVQERHLCRRALAGKIQIIGILLLVDLALVAGGGIWMNRMEHRRQQLAVRAQTALARSQELQQQLEGLKKKQEMMLWNRKLSLSSAAWLDAIDELTVCLPERSWLSRLETLPATGCIKIDGGAMGMSSVHLIASRLSSTGAFKDLTLASTEALPTSNLDAVKFSLSVKVSSIESPADGGGQAATAAPAAPVAPGAPS